MKGLVQGVGFRPFVYRLAHIYGLTGWVENTNENVVMRVTGKSEAITLFVASLTHEAPRTAVVEEVLVDNIEAEEYAAFTIGKSQNISAQITRISPDIGVCEECLTDISLSGNRLDYSFVNCTHCGPRFSIIRDLPYDRANTTMAHFEMCPDCRKEYETISDRRFHAQPTACIHCGPRYELWIKNKLFTVDIRLILNTISRLIDSGGIVAMKGLGGMHLACNAFDDKAVKRLRLLKNREAKPFAVLFRDLESAQKYTETDAIETQSLCSWRRPIVLLQLKNINVTQEQLSPNIAAGLQQLGVMLPYMPFHYQLFEQLKINAIVLTSGNFSSEPIVIDNQVALHQFSDKTDAVLLHNRDIFNRTDDSVVKVIGGKERVFRRSRGYVPTPVAMPLSCDGIIAFGAELTNTFCVGNKTNAFLSQHIGDLKSMETTAFYEETLARFLHLFRVKPQLLAVDLHPDYISTRTAERFRPLPVVAVQHHHAHIAACMAEHHLDEKVIGIALDGTGYGADGHIWGGEFLVCDLNDFIRITHFEYVPLPGGDLASEEPWRMAVVYLYKVFGRDFQKLKLPFLQQIEPEKIEVILQMIDRKVNCPLTSSAGRLFDAVAALLGLCQAAAFPAQAPMLLESLLTRQSEYSPEYQYKYATNENISFDDTIRGIVNDVLAGVNASIIAMKFHNTIISIIFETVKSMCRQTGIQKVVLSGGVFQNGYLLENVEILLKNENLMVYSHETIPTNDGGIALGQMAVASKRRDTKCV